MRRISLLLLALVSVVATSSRAQRVWLAPNADRNVSIDIDKGFYAPDPYSSFDFASFTITAQGRFPVNARTAVTLALPFSHVGVTTVPEYEFPAMSFSQTGIGNPWIGVEIAAAPAVLIEAGFRPGIAGEENEEALALGVNNDFDRYEAWLPSTSSGRVVAHIGRIPDHGPFVTAILGATFMIEGASAGGETELDGNYGVRAGFIGGGILGSVNVTGRINISQGDPPFDDRTVHQLALSVEGTRGGFRPSASIRMFLDEALRQQLKAILTVGGSFVIR